MDKVGLALDALEGVHVLNSDRHFELGEKQSWSESIDDLKQKLQYIEYELAVIANGGPSLGSENRMIKGVPNSLYHSIYPFRGTDLYPEFQVFGRHLGSVLDKPPTLYPEHSAPFRANGFNSCPPGYYMLVYRLFNSKCGFYLNTREGTKVKAVLPRGYTNRTISPSSDIMVYEPFYHPQLGGSNEFSGTWQISLGDNVMLPRGNSGTYSMTYIDVPLQDFDYPSAWGYSSQMLKKKGELDRTQILFRDMIHLEVESIGQLTLPYTLGVARESKDYSYHGIRLFARLNFPLVIESEGLKQLQPGEHLLTFTGRVDINTCVLVCSDKNTSINDILVYTHNGVTPVKYHKRRAREYLQVNFDLPDDHLSSELNTMQIIVLCTVTQTSTLVLQSIGEA